MENEALFKSKSGQNLYDNFLKGDLVAGYYFGQLVFKSNYVIEPIEGLKKKELKNKGVIDAENCIISSAESGYLPAIVDAADMYFSGRIESGSFPSRLLLPNYKKSTQWYLELLTLDIVNEIRALALFRIGLIAYMTENKVSDSTLDFWTRASKIPSTSANNALARIAGYYYEEKKYGKSIPLLEDIYKVKPYSAVLLALCYKHGYGVKTDLNKHNELMMFWEEETSKK